MVQCGAESLQDPELCGGPAHACSTTRTTCPSPRGRFAWCPNCAQCSRGLLQTLSYPASLVPALHACMSSATGCWQVPTCPLPADHSARCLHRAQRGSCNLRLQTAIAGPASHACKSPENKWWHVLTCPSPMSRFAAHIALSAAVALPPGCKPASHACAPQQANAGKCPPALHQRVIWHGAQITPSATRAPPRLQATPAGPWSFQAEMTA